MTCNCVRCGIGIASPSFQICGKVREDATRAGLFASCPAASTDAGIGSGGLAVLCAEDRAPAMHDPSLENCALEPQQFLLTLETAPVTGEASIGPDHAMTRQHDRKRIAVHHRAHRASCTRPLGASGQLPVGD